MTILDSTTPYKAARYNLETGNAKRGALLLRWNDGTDEIGMPRTDPHYAEIVHWFCHPERFHLVVLVTMRPLVAVHMVQRLAYCGQKESEVQS